MTITYKLDMERLLRKNDRKDLLEVIPNELHHYENTEKRYGKENAYAYTEKN